MQGGNPITTNECCTITGHVRDKSLKVAFFHNRWEVLDKAKAVVNAEKLKNSLASIEGGDDTMETVIALADICLHHYKAGEAEGWLREVRPAWEHDCEDCIFLGRANGDEVVDLYYCPNARPWPTLIARFSDEPHDYISGLVFGMCNLDERLAQAYRIAMETNLLTGVKSPIVNVIDQGGGSAEHKGA